MGLSFQLSYRYYCLTSVWFEQGRLTRTIEHFVPGAEKMNSTTVQGSRIENRRNLEGFFFTTLGQTDFRSDGSYVTTQWLSVLMVPLVPRASFRVLEARHFPKGAYKACEQVPLCFRQVFSVYLFAACWAAWALFIPLVTSEFLLDKPIWLFLASIMLMLWVPIAICRAARRRRRRKSRLNEALESQILYRARA